MTIMLYVLHEHSYDRWQAHADRTFSTWGTFHFGNSEYHSAAVSYQAGPLLQKGDANVEGFLRIWKAYREPVVQKVSMPRRDDQREWPLPVCGRRFLPVLQLPSVER